MDKHELNLRITDMNTVMELFRRWTHYNLDQRAMYKLTFWENESGYIADENDVHIYDFNGIIALRWRLEGMIEKDRLPKNQ